MESFEDDFKYKATKAMLKKLLHIKTPEAVLWRRCARRYLQNFELQWRYRETPTWFLDDELFDKLQREALILDLQNFG